MLEIPESTTIATQLDETVRGKTIRDVVVGTSPHKFAWYYADPQAYGKRLAGQTVGDSAGLGPMVEITAGDRRIVFSDGVNVRYFDTADKAPQKHQLLVTFDDGSVLVCSIQMYGGILAFVEGEYDNKYYRVAKAKPHPLTDAFDRAYFDVLLADSDKLSAKAFLAAEQRVPGLGNGTLQDILYTAGVHPKRRMGTLPDKERDRLFNAIKQTLSEMTRLGGRDTEKDIFGNAGGYRTRMSKKTVGGPCAVCGAEIQKAAYMGGAVYWGPACQPLA